MTADIIDLHRERNRRRGLLPDDDQRFDKTYLERAARGLLVDHERSATGSVWFCRTLDVFCDKPDCAAECLRRAELRASGRLFDGSSGARRRRGRP